MAAGPGGREVGRISIRVVPDVSGFREKLRSELAAVKDNFEVDVDVNLDTLKAKADMDVLMAKLKAQAKKGVTVETRVDNDRISGLLSGIASGAGGAAGKLGGLSHGLLIAAAVASFAAPALALVSGVLISLPAAIAAVLIPIAALALGMDGIKEAAKVLAPGFEDLKKTMSQVSKDAFTPVFEKLNAVFPTLAANLPKVTQGLADMAQGFVTSVTSAPGLAQIANIISRVGQFLSALQPTITKVTDGLLGLASRVADHFPGLANFIDQFATRFTNWVAKISKKDWFGNSPLDRAIGSFRDALQGIFDLVAKLGEVGFDFLSDPNFGKSMKDFLDGITSFVTTTAPGFKQFFTDIADIVKSIGDTMTKVDAWKPPDWVTGGKDQKKDSGFGGFPGVQPKPIEGLSFDDSDLLGSADKIQARWAELQTWFSTWWTNMTTGAASTWTAITNAASTAASGVSNAWTAVTGFLSGIWDGIKQSAITALGGIAQFLGNIPAQLSSAWASLGGIAAGAWQAVVAAVQNALSQAVQAVVTGIANIVSEVSQIGGKVAGAVGNLGSALVGAGRALMDGLLSGIKDALGGVLAFASGIAAKIAAVKGPLSYDKVVLKPAGEALMDGLSTGLQNGLSPILQQAKDMATQIFQAFKDVFGTAPNGVSFNFGGAGAAGVPQQLNQITSATKDFQSAVGNGMAPKKLDDQAKAQMDLLKQQQASLEIQAKQATLDSKNAASDEEKKKLQDLAAQYRIQKDQLGLQADQLKYAEQFGDTTKGTNAAMDGLGQKVGEAGTNFLQANATQAMSDLGIGGGAITAAIDQGIGLAKQYVFNVNGVDEALTAQKTLQNKEALQYTQRTG